ncbi:hypothetical protein QBC42DRAFT_264552 [Cladorrhinum samala]|uniref:Secreted protein n=1 Tax=Cladorrhinum samala TaxID=585594 RepID=A0AAV9HWL0_9PEZI|nr:hypothetical protein QBC42DRAFT_264552 [Cladorrhinum samala]
MFSHLMNIFVFPGILHALCHDAANQFIPPFFSSKLLEGLGPCRPAVVARIAHVGCRDRMHQPCRGLAHTTLGALPD